MQPFRLKLISELTERDFVEHEVWGSYYEPDDITTIASLGFEREAVHREIEATGFSEDYAFPLPRQAATAPLNYLYLSVRAETRGGFQLVGYKSGPAVAVFYGGKLFSFNALLHQQALKTASELGAALGETSVFPLQYQVVATSEVGEEDLY